MYKFFVFIFIACLMRALPGMAQAESDTAIKAWLRSHIAILADTSMHGRGYVNKGREQASKYIQAEFTRSTVKPVGKRKSFVQTYSFPVNTFPGKMELTINDHRLVAGVDYIIDAASSAYTGSNLTLEKIDLAAIAGNENWQKTITSLHPKHKVFYLENVDSACKKLGIRRRYLPFILPKGRYIIAQKEKFIWTVERENISSTVFYVNDSVLPGQISKVNISVAAKFLSKRKNDNIVGVIPGEVKDTFIAITAHYDHLGMMGSDAIFPGASDNASGTSMLLYMAHYFSTHPQHYSILFIAFSGEEAGLKGSEYYTRHPQVPLEQIKFLTNIDIMGDASDGITVVNATEYPRQFSLLQQINAQHNYLPQIKSRGKADNSDHYHFTEAGVPSIFIYTNGGKGYYHDIFDKADEISLKNVDNIVHLLIDFFKEIK